jgi:SAM-dependent methyltransferase
MIGRVLRKIAETGIATLDYAGFGRAAWKLRIGSEVDFWDNWLRTSGLEWPDDFAARLNPATTLQPHIAEVMHPVPGATINILDVGAGPLTFVGKTFPNCIVNITATDALAHEYDRLLKKYSIIPPVRTIAVEAEHLAAKFGPNRYDFVFARNCLDHSHDALRAVEEIVSVLKPEGSALLIHATNEAEHASWEGLHRWNFNVTEGRFLISSKFRTTDMNERLADRCFIQATVSAGGIHGGTDGRVVLRKLH